MKTFLTLILLMCIMEAKSQHLTSSFGLERTVSSTESQVALGYESRRQWAIGTFYQMPLAAKKENESSSSSWYGVYLNAPIMKSHKVCFYAQLRTGLVDEKFIVVVPSFETRMRLVKAVSVTVGASFRHTYPAVLMKLHIGLFNNNEHKRSQSTFK